MTTEDFKKYILNYKSKGEKDIQLLYIYDCKFTFLIHDGKAIGGVLDMDGEPDIYILEEYRGRGHGSRLLEKYLLVNKLVECNKYAFYNAITDDGEKLIKNFMKIYNEFKVIEVSERKYIILNDYRVKM